MLRPHCLSGTLAAVTLVVTAACSFSGDATTTTTSTRPTPSTTVVPLPGPPPVGAGACRPVPPAAPAMAWVPADLPLPPGTTPVEDLSQPPLSQGLFAVPGTLQDWVRFTNAEWHKTGWIQGRGEAEQGEVENTYVRPIAGGAEGGAWRVRDAYCDQRAVELLLIYKK